MNQHNSSISSFRHFVFRLFIPWLFVTGIIVAVGGYMFEKNIVLGSSIGGASKLNRIITDESCEEVTIFGSSRAQCSYIPDSIYPCSYNYGIDGTNMNIHLLFLEKELAKKRKMPVIVNLDMELFGTSTGDVSNYLSNISDPLVYEAVKDKVAHWQRVPFIKYYGYYEQYVKYYLNDRMNLTKVTNKGGSFEINPTVKSVFDKQVEQRRNTPTRFQYVEQQDRRFKALIEKRPDRQIILVVAPYHASYLEAYQNKEEFYNYLDQLKRYKNVHVLDYSAYSLPDSCFFNTTHINYTGAKIFSGMLGDTLAKCNFFIPEKVAAR